MGDPRQTENIIYLLNDNGQGPELLHEVFKERGWVEYDEELHDTDDWSLWWRTSRFRNSDYDKLKPWQQMNHYPRSNAITKKDSLARNLKRMKGVYGSGIYNFSPVAFNLPNDYTKFVAEYSRMKESNPNKDICWICKPADLSRGRGIFIFRDLSELQYDCNAVVQQYLTNPMLIGGYKFDLRIYVMVPSFHPLKIFIYQEGLVRFGTEKFDMNSLGNLYSHLTNTSINKHSPSYTADKERVGPGCKWTLTQLKHYFRQANIDDKLLWRRITNIVVLTLALQANQVPKLSNCFELYGFDIIIDDQLKPWLLEVNFSPALSSDCQTDLIVKKPMLHDLFDFLNFPELEQIRLKAEKERVKAGFMNKSVRNSNSRFFQRPSSQSKYLQRHGGKLPQLVQGIAQNQGSHYKSDLASTHGVEESDDGNESDSSDVVPVIPGCGLPSVQEPKSKKQSGDSGLGSRGSSASSRRSFDYSDELGRSESRISSVLTQKNMKRVDSKGSQLVNLGETAREYHKEGKVVRNKREPKISLQSDSGVSSISGSSDNMEVQSPPENLSYEKSLKSKSEANIMSRSPYAVKSSALSPRNRNEDSVVQRKSAFHSAAKKVLNQNYVSQDSSQKNALPSGTVLMSRYALTDLNDVGIPNVSNDLIQEHQQTVKITRPLPRATRSSVLRTSFQADNKKKYGQFGFTANPLSGKTGVLNRKSGLNNVLNPSRNSNISRPWRNVKPSVYSQENKKETVKPTQLQVGDFYLVYPFNEATRKCSAGNQDIKIVIREVQKLLKEQSNGTIVAPSTTFDVTPLWETVDS